MLAKTEIQGLVFSGYAHWPGACFRVLHILDPDAARRWLGRELDRLTFGADDPAAAKAARHGRNLAFSHAGLAVLGLPEQGALGFERAFREGMATPQRSALLGDLPGGPSDPEAWLWGGGRTRPVHLLQMLYANDEAAAQRLCEAQVKATAAFLQDLVPPRAVRLTEDRREHFGFADGISQPAYDGLQRNRGGRGYAARRLAAGELLLGHPDGLGNTSLGAVVDVDTPGAGLLPRTRDGLGDFAVNGAYLVCRQMRQDVTGFRGMLTDLAQSATLKTLLPDFSAEERAGWTASRIVGRWPSGCPVTSSPDRDDPQFALHNDFLFEASDGGGLACPFGAHVRRANPRDSQFEPWRTSNARRAARSLADNDRRRLLRRGRLFGPSYEDAPDAERGLMFVALGASIERQFEFVQHSWVLNPNFAGLAGETDPLVGGPDTTLTLQARPFARRLSGVSPHVWTEAGGYFFLPSRSALRFLAARAETSPSDAAAAGLS